MVPKCIYATQSFESWLQFFLSRQQIEEHLEKSFQQEQTRRNSPQPSIMRDVQDSPAWRGLGNYLWTRYHLVFAFYIDWFNPFTNKIAGTSLYSGTFFFFPFMGSLLYSHRSSCILRGNCHVLPQSSY